MSQTGIWGKRITGGEQKGQRLCDENRLGCSSQRRGVRLLLWRRVVAEFRDKNFWIMLGFVVHLTEFSFHAEGDGKLSEDSYYFV